MRNMSFALTSAAIVSKKKTVTRRLGWRFLKVGDLVRPVFQSQGLKRGERIQAIGRDVLEVVSVRRELLNVIDGDEVEREGCGSLIVAEFIQFFCQANGCKPDKEVTRIEFEYVDDPGQLVTHHMQDDAGA